MSHACKKQKITKDFLGRRRRRNDVWPSLLSFYSKYVCVCVHASEWHVPAQWLFHVYTMYEMFIWFFVFFYEGGRGWDRQSSNCFLLNIWWKYIALHCTYVQYVCTYTAVDLGISIYCMEFRSGRSSGYPGSHLYSLQYDRIKGRGKAGDHAPNQSGMMG